MDNENTKVMDKWEVPKREVLKGCPRMKKVVAPTIEIEHDVWEVVKALCSKVKIEWQMLLTGIIDDDTNTCYVTGYIIPKQTVTTTSVENHEIVDIDYINLHNIVAGIHSHGGMGTFFSGTDDATNKSSIRYHIVVNNKLEYDTVARIKTLCGCETEEEPELFIVNAPIVPEVDIVGYENIEEKKYVYNPTAYEHIGYRGYGWNQDGISLKKDIRQDALDSLSGEETYYNGTIIT